MSCGYVKFAEANLGGVRRSHILASSPKFRLALSFKKVNLEEVYKICCVLRYISMKSLGSDHLLITPYKKIKEVTSLENSYFENNFPV